MIISVKNGSGVSSAIAALSGQYKNESVSTFPNFLVDSAGDLILEKDGSLPKRMTFLGHATQKYFGGHTASIFTTLIINQIEKAALVDPQIKTSLAEIDLLGCRLGLMGGNGRCFASDVANALQKAGYNLAVRAISNRGLPEASTWHSMIFSYSSRTEQFYARGFKDEETREQYNALKEAKHEAADAEKLLLAKKMRELAIEVMPRTIDVRAHLDRNSNHLFARSLPTVPVKAPQAKTRPVLAEIKMPQIKEEQKPAAKTHLLAPLRRTTTDVQLNEKVEFKLSQAQCRLLKPICRSTTNTELDKENSASSNLVLVY